MSKWQPMKKMPTNELVLVGVWVNHNESPKPHFEYYVAMYDWDGDGGMVDQAWEPLPWDDPKDYDGWMPLPKPMRNNK